MLILQTQDSRIMRSEAQALELHDCNTGDVHVVFEKRSLHEMISGILNLLRSKIINLFGSK